MSFRPAKSVCLALLASLPACNQLEAIDATDSGGGGGGIPTAVRTAFTESCGKTGCHGETGPTKPPLAGTALDDILTGQGAGGPFVTLGDTANSYIAVKMLPDATLSALGLTRTGSRMPLDGAPGLAERLHGADARTPDALGVELLQGRGRQLRLVLVHDVDAP